MFRIIVTVLFATGVLLAEPIDGAGSTADDLVLDEAALQASNALGNYAWGVFLALQGRDLEESHGRYLAEALKNLPESEALLQELVRPWVRRRDYRGAIEVIEPVAKARPEARRIQVFLGLMYHAAGMFPEAIKQFEHVYYTLANHEPVVLRELSSLYWRENRRHDVEKLLRHAGKTKDLQWSFVVDYGWALFHSNIAQGEDSDKLSTRVRRRHRRLAVKYAKRAAGKYGSEQDLTDCESLLKVLIGSEEYAAADDLLARACNLFPRMETHFLLRRADLQVAAGKGEKAVEILRSLDLQQIVDAATLAQIGGVAIKAEDARLALKAFEKALPLAPQAASIRVTYAVLLTYFDRQEESVAILDGISDLNARGRMIKCRALMNLERWDKAEEEWLLVEKAAENEGNKGSVLDVQYRLAGATIYEQLGRIEDSIIQAEKAFALEPENPVVANFLGYVLADHGLRLNEAEELIVKALKAEPESDAFLDSLAWVYYRKQRFEEALEAMTRCLRYAEPSADPVILDHAGDIFMAIGSRDLAVLYWWRALQSDPKDPRAIRKKIEG